MKKILIYGYGNPGREDDGLGIAFADALEKWAQKQNLEGICFDVNYQLNIEDAHTISNYDLVLFADASQEDIEHFAISPVKPSNKVNFTMHTVSPSYVCHLCSKIFNRTPDAFLLHIKGYQWEMKEGLSSSAEKNLQMALDLIQSMLSSSDTLKSQLEGLHEVFM